MFFINVMIFCWLWIYSWLFQPRVSYDLMLLQDSFDENSGNKTFSLKSETLKFLDIKIFKNIY